MSQPFSVATLSWLGRLVAHSSSTWQVSAGGPFKPHFGLSGAFPRRKPSSSREVSALLVAQRFDRI